VRTVSVFRAFYIPIVYTSKFDQWRSQDLFVVGALEECGMGRKVSFPHGEGI